MYVIFTFQGRIFVSICLNIHDTLIQLIAALPYATEDGYPWSINNISLSICTVCFPWTLVGLLSLLLEWFIGDGKSEPKIMNWRCYTENYPQHGRCSGYEWIAVVGERLFEHNPIYYSVSFWSNFILKTLNTLLSLLCRKSSRKGNSLSRGGTSWVSIFVPCLKSTLCQFVWSFYFHKDLNNVNDIAG